VARDRHGAISAGFVEYRAKFVFDLGGRDGGDIDQHTLAISKRQHGHDRASTTISL
jgi:hypothetical protein